jgi:hypothetical protein
MTAGQDGFRNANAKHSGGLLRPMHATAFFTSRIDRSPSARFLARSNINPAGPLRSCSPAAPIHQAAEAATKEAALPR